MSQQLFRFLKQYYFWFCRCLRGNGVSSSLLLRLHIIYHLYNVHVRSNNANFVPHLLAESSEFMDLSTVKHVLLIHKTTNYSRRPSQEYLENHVYMRSSLSFRCYVCFFEQIGLLWFGSPGNRKWLCFPFIPSPNIKNIPRWRYEWAVSCNRFGTFLGLLHIQNYNGDSIWLR